MEKPYYIAQWLWDELSDPQRKATINRGIKAGKIYKFPRFIPDRKKLRCRPNAAYIIVKGQRRYKSKVDGSLHRSLRARNDYYKTKDRKILLKKLKCSAKIRKQILDNWTEIQYLVRLYGNAIPYEQVPDVEIINPRSKKTTT